MSPLNRSTDSIRSRQVVSSEPAATADAVTEGNRSTCSQHVADAVEIVGPLQPLQIVPPFVFQLARLDQQEPALAAADNRLKWACGLARPAPAPSLRRRRPAARLRWLETSKRRIDSISSPKNSIRTGSYQSGAKMSMMPPRTRELARHFHGRSCCESRSRPASGPVLQRKLVAGPQRPRLPGQRVAVGHRLQRAWMLVTTNRGGCGRLQQLQQPQPVAEASSCADPLAGDADSQAGKLFRRDRAVRSSARSSTKSSMSSACGQTTTSGRGACAASVAATSAQLDPQTPSIVAACPASDSRPPRRSLLAAPAGRPIPAVGPAQ